MNCEYNNSMYTVTPPELEVEFDSFEELLSNDDYETEEELNHHLNIYTYIWVLMYLNIFVMVDYCFAKIHLST